MRGLLFSTNTLFHEQRGEEDKDIGLDETIEQIKVQAEDGRHEHRDHQLDELHDDESAQHVAEQSHTQAGGADGDLEDVHGGHDGGRSGEALEEALAAPGMDAGILDEADAHERQRSGDIQILRGGLDAEHADEVRTGDVESHRHEVRHIPSALLAQQAREEVVDGGDDHLKDGLPPGDVVHLEVPGEQDGDDAEDSLAELAELVKTAGASVAGTLIQKRELIHPGTYVGTGKVAEIAELLEHTGATGIVCDDELSPAQLKNLETMLNTKVMDRTLIILDIFAARATTSEGKIQVELAQLKYRLSRLTGLGRSMSRLGGGIGTRGPGEKKLEIDRRLINDRIAQLNRELKEVVKHREIARAKRERNAVPVVAIVGYTNAGKSTLLNHLTDAEVLEEDKLFATLDPTTRMLELEGHQQVLLTDTVGFIRKLPHHLIEAFKSTLEEAKYADYIIHVVDASNPQRDKQMYIVYETLDHLGVKNKKILTLFNKIDIRTDDDPLQDFRADHVLQISATENAGLDAVKDVLQEMLREDKIYIERVIPYAQAGVLQLVRNKGELVSEEYVPEGISIRAYVPMEVYGKL